MDLLSRGAPVYGEWTPGSCGTDMGSLWVGLSRSVCFEEKRAVRDVLFSAKCRFFPGPLRVPYPSPDSSYSVQSEGTRPCVDINSPILACYALAGGDISAALGPAVTGGRDGLPPAPGVPSAVCLAPEWLNFSAGGLLPRVISTIQSARAFSTRSLYDCSGECLRNGHILFQLD